LALIFLVSCNNNRNEDVIAVIDDVEIKKDYYVDKLLEYRNKYKLPDNGQVRGDLLKKLVSERMFIYDAKMLGLDSDSIAQHERQRNYIQKSLNTFVEKNIIENLTISDEELKRYLVISSTKIRARHLYAQTRKQADSLYNLVKRGQKFEDLARNIFDDPLLSESGGDLGYFTYNEMDLAFADYAFSMKIGEISPPVKTKDGYSIIKIEDRIGNPLITETEFLNKKDKLYSDYRFRKKKVLAKDFVDSVASDLRISFNEAALNIVFSKMGNSGILNKELEQPNNADFSDDEKQITLLNSRNDEWTIKDFLEKARYTSTIQRKWIRNKENLEDFVKGLVVRKYVLEQAELQGITSDEHFKQSLEDEFNHFLVNRIHKNIKSDMVFTEKEMQTYYNENTFLFKESSKVRLSEIILDSEKSAIKITKELQKGRKFSELAREFSINKNTAVHGGEVGYVSLAELGPFAEMIFSLKDGEWKGPITKGKLYFFLQRNSVLDSSIADFEEAKQMIREKLIVQNIEAAVENRLKTIRHKIEVLSYPEKLKTLRYYN